MPRVRTRVIPVLCSDSLIAHGDKALVLGDNQIKAVLRQLITKWDAFTASVHQIVSHQTHSPEVWSSLSVNGI